MPKSKPALTLADCTVPIPLRCLHCEHELPLTAKLEVYKPYVVVACPKCGCSTPFYLEQTA